MPQSKARRVDFQASCAGQRSAQRHLPIRRGVSVAILYSSNGEEMGACYPVASFGSRRRRDPTIGSRVSRPFARSTCRRACFRRTRSQRRATKSMSDCDIFLFQRWLQVASSTKQFFFLPFYPVPVQHPF